MSTRADEVAGGDPVRGGFHRRERTGHATGEVGGDERGTAEREDRRAEDEPAAVAEGLLFTSSASTTTGVSSFTLVSGSAWKTVLPSLALLRLARLQRGDVEVVLAHAVRQRRLALSSTPSRPPRNSRTVPSASMATTAPSDTLRVVCTSARMRRI